MTDKSIFQLKATLLAIEPPIWRRLLVHRETTLHELHHILQDAMGWANGHLHAFRIGKDSYSDYRDEFGGPPFRDETRVPLARVTGLRKRFVYEYDFGDGWEHLIAVEKELPIEPGVAYPRCIDGARACPPEDCGGPPGYQEMLKVLGDPSDRDHAELKEWLGGDHDPEAFDVAATDARLRAPACGCDHDEHHRDDFADIEDIDDVDDVVELTPEQLAGLGEEQLIGYMADLADRVPRAVIDVCASRGAAMIQGLAALCADDEFWVTEDDEDEGWQWLRLHGPHILGLIGGEAAARLLISWLYRLDEVDDGDTQDSLAGYWPALLREAPDTVLPHLLAASRDTDLRWYARCQTVEAYLACRARSGAESLEHALDEIAAIAADEADSTENRAMIATVLLSYPRERHRELLERLAARNEPWTIEMQEVADAFARNQDDPPWTAFANPWRCYEPDEIEQRRRRWAEVAATRAAYDEPEYDDELDPSGELDPDYDERSVVRATPKVGRNDPCPCGSGKKYKKCCMNAGG